MWLLGYLGLLNHKWLTCFHHTFLDHIFHKIEYSTENVLIKILDWISNKNYSSSAHRSWGVLTRKIKLLKAGEICQSEHVHLPQPSSFEHQFDIITIATVMPSKRHGVSWAEYMFIYFAFSYQVFSQFPCSYVTWVNISAEMRVKSIPKSAMPSKIMEKKYSDYKNSKKNTNK